MRAGFIKPENLMDFFDGSRQALAERYINIARNDDSSVEIDLTSANGTPCFQVVQDGIIVSEIMKSRAEAQGYYEGVLKHSGFIQENEDNSTLLNVEEDTEESDGYEDDTSEFLTPEQDERLVEVFCAMEDLLVVLLGEGLESFGIVDADLEELCAEIGKFLYKKCDISIYFPTETMDADGNFYVEDYPFEEKEEE